MVLPGAKPLYLRFAILEKFQFAWRFLSLAVFPPAVFLAAAVYLLPKRFKHPAVIALAVVVLGLNSHYYQAKDFLHQPESFYTQPYPSPTDTGESAPRWSVRFMEDYPLTHIEVIDGQAEIQEIDRKTNRHEYRAAAVGPVRLVENTLYFPGWQVLVNGQPVEIQFQDPAYRGLMTFNLPSGQHQIVVKFGETKLRLFADLISLVALGGLVAGILVIKLKER